MRIGTTIPEMNCSGNDPRVIATAKRVHSVVRRQCKALLIDDAPIVATDKYTKGKRTAAPTVSHLNTDEFGSAASGIVERPSERPQNVSLSVV